MPTLLRIGRYRFYVVMADCDEPPHVHVSGGGGEAKIWLRPVAMTSGAGYSRHETRQVERLVADYRQLLNDR